MTKNILYISITLVVILFSQCNSNIKQNTDKLKTEELQYIKSAGYTQGTTFHITYGCKDGKNYQKEFEEILHNFDLSLSTYIDKSLISRINQNETSVKVDKYLKTVFEKSVEISEETDGAFDFTVGALVKAWGFYKQNNNSDVDKEAIDSLLRYVDYKLVSLQGDTIVKNDPNIRFDVNAIAQGYAVDVICDFLESKEVNNYLVEIGGELTAKGTKANNILWKIGVDKPIDNAESGENLQVILEIKDRSIATSGNYRKFYLKNGIKYAHSINPKTGYPVNHSLLSATVFANDCITADAYATAFMVMGIDKSKVLLKKHPELDAYFIYSDSTGRYQVYYTEQVKEFMINLEN